MDTYWHSEGHSRAELAKVNVQARRRGAGKVDTRPDRVGGGWLKMDSDLIRNDSVEGGIAVR